MAAPSSPSNSTTPVTSLLQSFDMVGCARRSIEKVVDEKGLKILLMDESTKDVVSMCYSFSDLLQRDLYLVDSLATPNRQKQGHLKAIVFVRPTEENVQRIAAELHDPKYAEYHLYFTNIVPAHLLDDLALADEHEAVKQVLEVYSDYFPLQPYAFSVDVSLPMLTDRDLTGGLNTRIVDTLIGVLLSVRRRPHIRYQSNSSACSTLAKELVRCMSIDAPLFEFRRSDDCLLLLVDRVDDLVTPLLTQWTYEAMVHEEFGVYKHKTSVPVTGDTETNEEFNLVPFFDQFWSDNLHANWGDLCTNVKTIVDSYREKTKTDATASTNLEELRRVMDKMPELRKESITLGKHTAIAAELGKIIRKRHLLDLSLLEQDMVCSNRSTEHAERVEEMLSNGDLLERDLVRLVLLYMLRWERNRDNKAVAFKRMLESRGISDKERAALDNVLMRGGASQRASDLFDDKKFTSILRAAVKGMQDVENVYTQHDPLLKRTLQHLLKGKLSHDCFPFFSNPRCQTPPKEWKPREIIAFIVGGLTCEEMKTAEDIMREYSQMEVKVVLGGTDLLRTGDIIDGLAR